ncbi:MAG: gliding motility protein GldC [Flavobacteriales bacterium]
MKQSEIKFDITLDDNSVPEKIMWAASDTDKQSEAKAIMLAIWDAHEQTTMRIDLWNKEMKTDEMKQMVHQTLMTLADAFERATGEKPMAGAMREFGQFFAEKMKLVGPL